MWLQIHYQSVGHSVFQIFPQLWLVHFLFENSCSGKIRACGCGCVCVFLYHFHVFVIPVWWLLLKISRIFYTKIFIFLAEILGELGWGVSGLSMLFWLGVYSHCLLLAQAILLQRPAIPFASLVYPENGSDDFWGHEKRRRRSFKEPKFNQMGKFILKKILEINRKFSMVFIF